MPQCHCQLSPQEQAKQGIKRLGIARLQALDECLLGHAGRLYITPQETAALLEALYTDGFLVSTDHPPRDPPPRRYRYHCLSNDLADMVDRVAYFYATYLIPVTNLIHAKSQTGVQAFADAFKFRKDG